MIGILRIGLAVSIIFAAAPQLAARNPEGSALPVNTITFRFLSGDDMFYVREKEGMKDNAVRLQELSSVIDQYRPRIVSGEIPVYVDAYSASLNGDRSNRKLSFIRANRVKTELILNCGLREQDFITKNYAVPYGRHNDVVVVTLRIPGEEEPPKPEPAVCPPPAIEEKADPVEEQPEVVTEPLPVVEPLDLWRDPYCFSVRTNLLYDVLLTPTIGVEWRPNRHVGIKVDGSWAHWGSKHGRVQKIWLVSPEVRWYMLDNKRLYLGLGANFGEVNIYKGLASAISSSTGYQGNIYGGGVVVGYQLPLNKCLSMDFNLGIGLTHFKHDTFHISNDVRVYKDRDLTKNFWGPTQAGVSLVWKVWK